MAPNFLDLAREIRDQIYIEALVPPTGLITHHYGNFSFHEYPEASSSIILSLSLLSTCRQIRDEAMPIFLSNTLHITHLAGIESQPLIARRLRRVEIHLNLNLENSLGRLAQKMIVLNRWASLREVCMDIKLWQSEDLEHALVERTIQLPIGSVLLVRLHSESFSAVQIARLILQISGELEMPMKLVLDTRTSPDLDLEAEVRKLWMEKLFIRGRIIRNQKEYLKKMERELRGAFKSEVWVNGALAFTEIPTFADWAQHRATILEELQITIETWEIRMALAV
jgi:hypothetical protein